MLYGNEITGKPRIYEVMKVYEYFGGGSPINRHSMKPDIAIVAGDDLTLGVEFECDDYEDFALSDGDAAELIIHLRGDKEQVFAADEYDGNTAYFYISGKETAELLTENYYEEFDFCVRVTFEDGIQNTPIHRGLMVIRRC